MKRTFCFLVVVAVLAFAGVARAGTTYTIRPGDSLSRIGQKFKVPWREIAEANSIEPPRYVIYAGKTLVIPAADGQFYWRRPGTAPYHGTLSGALEQFVRAGLLSQPVAEEFIQLVEARQFTEVTIQRGDTFEGMVSGPPTGFTPRVVADWEAGKEVDARLYQTEYEGKSYQLFHVRVCGNWNLNSQKLPPPPPPPNPCDTNHLPMPVITGPTEAEVGQRFVLSGTGSSDPDGDVIAFQWIKNNDNHAFSEAKTLTLTASQPGTYTVTLAVADKCGESRVSHVVTVAPEIIAPPAAPPATEKKISFQCTPDAWAWAGTWMNRHSDIDSTGTYEGAMVECRPLHLATSWADHEIGLHLSYNAVQGDSEGYKYSSNRWELGPTWKMIGRDWENVFRLGYFSQSASGRIDLFHQDQDDSGLYFSDYFSLSGRRNRGFRWFPKTVLGVEYIAPTSSSQHGSWAGQDLTEKVWDYRQLRFTAQVGIYDFYPSASWRVTPDFLIGADRSWGEDSDYYTLGVGATASCLGNDILHIGVDHREQLGGRGDNWEAGITFDIGSLVRLIKAH